MQKQLEEKEKVDREQSNIIKRLEKMCNDLRKELTDRGDTIKRLEEKVNKLEKQPEKRIVPGNPKYIPYDEEGDESKTIQSQIVPGHLLNMIAKPAAEALIPPTTGGFKKTKQQPAPPVMVAEAKVEEEPDEEEIEELYSSRL